jgi:Flp pilus assembly protein TadG
MMEKGIGRRRRGATLVETAIVLGAFLLFLLGVFEFSRLLLVRHLVDSAAREGARLAVVSTSSFNLAAIENEVRSRLAGQVSDPIIEVYKVDPTTGANLGNWSSAGYGEYIAVRVTVTYHWMLPTFWNSQGMSATSTTLTGLSIMASEAN